MNRKRTALAVAAAGTATGVVGLVLIASPAGANEPPPALPPISSEALVQSVLDSKVPALSGAVALQNNLGLPVPGLPQSSGKEAFARVYSDGTGRARLSLGQGTAGERTIVHDNGTTWFWNSADRSVVKYTGGAEHESVEDKLADPATASRTFIEAIKQDSVVTVDGTARVANRPVYQLVLTPKPTERTLLREVRVSVDEATRLPLQVEVLANGQSEPALKLGFTEFSTGAQDASLFSFTPPAGAKVTEPEVGDKPTEKQRDDLFAALDLKVVGEGWDTVLTGKIPAGALDQQIPQGQGRGGVDITSVLKQLGKPVSGPFGTGYAISTNVGTALVTTDGRVAVGAVPQQVLVDALGQK
ncbi:outer membrane lipoprotein carrier protein LolA [Actinokineospora sp. NBRC 105648]|uniref:LolA family protein n=1 Tax=Actinokineospora sp. NBRC 105648 TaxID=3032206 RepID=UPI0024A33881|nr:outer membrane lipoprotein carrier protein LolA [Actinokineospora sp. NBRC 105648]GLZ41190.1 membrane protein [Actinokineospora sp. NBRC 105648]